MAVRNGPLVAVIYTLYLARPHMLVCDLKETNTVYTKKWLWNCILWLSLQFKPLCIAANLGPFCPAHKPLKYKYFSTKIYQKKNKFQWPFNFFLFKAKVFIFLFSGWRVAEHSDYRLLYLRWLVMWTASPSEIINISKLSSNVCGFCPINSP